MKHTKASTAASSLLAIWSLPAH